MSVAEIVVLTVGVEILVGIILALAQVMHAHRLPRWWALFVFLPGIGLVWLALYGMRRHPRRS